MVSLTAFWTLLCVSTFLVTNFFLHVLIGVTSTEPEYSPRTNYTNGAYNTYWANVYQTNAALQDTTFAVFICDPQRHLHEKVLSLPLINVDEFEPLLLPQHVASLESYLLHVDQQAIDAARVELSNADFEYLRQRVQLDGKTLLQF